MARAGIYKSDVVRARNILIAQRRHPSIDAVRVALGNTGSQGTIHRYLKEIEEEEVGSPSKINSSEAIQELVLRLAERLGLEARAETDAAAARHAVQVAELSTTIERVREELTTALAQLTRARRANDEGATARTELEGRISASNVESAELKTQLTQQEARLAEAQAHAASLEEKHRHAHDALEHFRVAAREQRDRELRQHEQQQQFLQGELAKGNSALLDKQAEVRAVMQERMEAIAQLQALRIECRHLEDRTRDFNSLRDRFVSQGEILQQAQAQLSHQIERANESRMRNVALEQRHLELERLLAAATAAVTAKDQVLAEALARLDSRER
jgi:hypothetical protein